MSRIWTVSNINLLFFRTLLISAYVHFDVFLYLCRHLTLLLRTTISCPLGLSLTILFSKNMPENQASLPEESGQIWMQWTSYHVSCVMHGALRKEWHEHETTLTSSRGWVQESINWISYPFRNHLTATGAYICLSNLWLFNQCLRVVHIMPVLGQTGLALF